MYILLNLNCVDAVEIKYGYGSSEVTDASLSSKSYETFHAQYQDHSTALKLQSVGALHEMSAGGGGGSNMTYLGAVSAATLFQNLVCG